MLQCDRGARFDAKWGSLASNGTNLGLFEDQFVNLGFVRENILVIDLTKPKRTEK